MTKFALMNRDIFNRAERLLGEEALQRLNGSRVIVFGVGGVGSWCAESLVRTGVGHLTIVDSDRVAVSNINRQMMATTLTVGEVKVEALRRRLLEINPDADITALCEAYTPETASAFDLDSWDVVIDCIDSLSNKALLIERATSSRARFFSSMGAALKADPTRVAVAEFYQVKGCPLARALRQRFKKNGTRLRRKFKCVYSDELLPNLGGVAAATGSEWDARKAAVNGSLMHITAIFGLTLAGLALSWLSTDGSRGQCRTQ